MPYKDLEDGNLLRESCDTKQVKHEYFHSVDYMEDPELDALKMKDKYGNKISLNSILFFISFFGLLHVAFICETNEARVFKVFKPTHVNGNELAKQWASYDHLRRETPTMQLVQILKY